MTTALFAFAGDLDAARRGDRAAFGRIVEQHRNLVSSLALAIVRDVATSEDVAQDVFVAAWQRLGDLRSPASLLPWLRQITRNRARDAQALGRRAVADSEAIAGAVDPADLHARLERTEEERVLAECLEALSDDDREVVTLFYREGQSVRQVAALLELNEDAVKKRLSRARERLREAACAQFGEAAEATRPGAQFTRAVLAALPGGAVPGFLGSGAGLAAKLGKLAPLLGGAAFGLASGLFGIWSGVGRAMRRARDDEERRELRRVGWVSSAIVTGFVVGFVCATHFDAPRWTAAVLWVVFAGSFAAIQLWWMPRITGRRLAAERAEDSTAERRQRRDRRLELAANAVAYAVSSVPIILYLVGYLN